MLEANNRKGTLEIDTQAPVVMYVQANPLLQDDPTRWCKGIDGRPFVPAEFELALLLNLPELRVVDHGISSKSSGDRRGGCGALTNIPPDPNPGSLRKRTHV